MVEKTPQALYDAFYQSIADRDAVALCEVDCALKEFINVRGYESFSQARFHEGCSMLEQSTGKKYVFSSLLDLLEYAESHPNEPAL